MAYYIQNDYLSEEVVPFLTAEIILALDAIHKQHYIYRDLKPDNVLFDGKGHVHLIDFGLCLPSSKKWVCGGTPEYLPPEVINHSSFDETADWWQLGIIVWEMLTKSTPFTGITTRHVYHNINNHLLKKPLSMSISISFQLITD